MADQSGFQIYGFDRCPFCLKAKKLLTSEDRSFAYTEIPDQAQRGLWLDDRAFRGGDRTFPKIYRIENGAEIYIGGYRELEDHLFTL